jgi:hypothetical protein
VIALGAGGAGLLAPASIGAVAALLLVAIVGLIVHKPLSAIPENTLKFIVGVLLSIRHVLDRRGARLGVARPGLVDSRIDSRFLALISPRRCAALPQPCHEAPSARQPIGSHNAMDQNDRSGTLRPVC